MGVIVPIRNAQRGMIGTISRHASTVALFDLGDEDKLQAMGSCGKAEPLARLLDGHVFSLAFPFRDSLFDGKLMGWQHAAEILRDSLRDLPHPMQEWVEHVDVIIARCHFASDG